jgi:hypothetical protein
MSEQRGLDRDGQFHAISTYRYLRLAIVTVILTLAVSLALEKHAASCWQDSVSSYYYTPVHSIFVAALAVIGVALIAIRGGTLLEEICLNMAGFLAPVVAFVPTAWSRTNCPSNLTATSRSTVEGLLSGNHFFAKFSTNNLVAFIVGGAFAVLLTSGVARIRRKRDRLVPLGPELWWPALGCALLVVVGFFWHRWWPANFNQHAHSYSAIGLFVLAGIVIFLTARRNKAPYSGIYYACLAGILAGFVVFLVGLLVTWRHRVLVVEAIETTAFVVFWFLQTIQLWDEGLIPVPSRTPPAAAA